MVPYKDAPAVAGLSNWEAWDVVLDQFAVIPGVVSVAGTTSLPFEAPLVRVDVQASATPARVETTGTRIAAYAVTPGYFETMGSALLMGRDLGREDGSTSEPVVLVNQAFVRYVLGGREPTVTSVLVDGDREATIIGVVEDVVQMRAEEGFQPAVYFPYTQLTPMAGVHVVIRTTQPMDVVVPEARRIAAELTGVVDPSVGTMPGLIARTRASPRFQALLLVAFGLVSLLIAASGLYSSLAQFVRRRRRELGVRIALGANRLDVLTLVLTEGMGLVIAGIIIGMFAAFGSAQLIEGFLFEVQADDPSRLAGVAMALALVSAVACLGPALRATAVDPVEVLWEE
jgi:putative ABC transport system permease protein